MRTSFNNHRLSLVLRFCAVAGVSLIVGLPTGCRGTRSSIGQLPGMGWVSPTGDDVQFESWNESETSSISTPADQATPQVATQDASPATKPTPSGSTTRRESYPLADTKPADTTPPAEYPDTGYPSPRELQLSGGGDRYPTGAADKGAIAGRQADPKPQIETEPKRGFYNQGYEEFADDSTEPEADEPGPSRYSRFSTSGANDDAASETLPTNDYASEPVDQYADDPTVTAGGSRWSQTVDSTSDDSGAGSDSAAAAAADSFASSDDASLDDSDASLSDRATEYAKGAVSRFGQQINDAGEDFRGGVDRFTDSTRGAVEAAQEKFGAATQPLNNGYESDTNEPSLDDIENASNDYGEFAADHRADDLNAAAPYNELPPAYEEPAVKPASKPWRPGSTSTYESLDNDQSRRSPYGVAPASFPAEYQSDRRFAPTYR